MAHHDDMSREARGEAYNALKDAKNLVLIAIRQIERAAETVGGGEGAEIKGEAVHSLIEALFAIRKSAGELGSKKPAWLRQR